MQEDLKKLLTSAQSVSIDLPDGPYGRPFDNQYELTKIDTGSKERKVTIYLSSGIEISISNKFSIRIEDNIRRIFKIVEIYNFDRVDFTDGVERKFYREGILRFTLF